MWSEKKYIDITMNILLFLLGINIFHYGQLLLPIMCLILFIDKGLKFKVKDIKVFSVLCLFAISFCAFSYKLGFYCVMGFCLPMAYYIGSNMDEYSENNIKKVIYIITFGMVAHLLLNFVYDITISGSSVMRRSMHYDIWTQAYMSPNTTAVNCLLIFACFYYLFLYENNKKYKIIGIFSFAIALVYDFSLGRRTPMYTLMIVVFLSILFDFLIIKNSNNKKIPLLLIGIPIFMVLIIVILYFNNLFGIKNILDNVRFIIKLKDGGILDLDRVRIVMNAAKYIPNNLWGGQVISTAINSQIHELWLDIYDYAGIIPYVLMIIYSVIYVCEMFVVLKNKKLSKQFRILVFGIVICIVLIMFIEPIMTGSSLFLICTVLISTSINSLNEITSKINE